MSWEPTRIREEMSSGAAGTTGDVRTSFRFFGFRGDWRDSRVMGIAAICDRGRSLGLFPDEDTCFCSRRDVKRGDGL